MRKAASVLWTLIWLFTSASIVFTPVRAVADTGTPAVIREVDSTSGLMSALYERTEAGDLPEGSSIRPYRVNGPVHVKLNANLSISLSDNKYSAALQNCPFEYNNNTITARQTVWLYPGSVIDLNGHTLTLGNLKFYYMYGESKLSSDVFDPLFIDSSSDKTGKIVFNTGNSGNTTYAFDQSGRILGGFLTDVYTSSENAFKDADVFNVPWGVTLHLNKSSGASVDYVFRESVKFYVSGRLAGVPEDLAKLDGKIEEERKNTFVTNGQEFLTALGAGAHGGQPDIPVFITLSQNLTVNYLDNGGVPCQDLWLYPGSVIDLNGNELKLNNLRLRYRADAEWLKAKELRPVIRDSSAGKTGSVVMQCGNAANTLYALEEAQGMLGGYLKKIEAASNNMFKTTVPTRFYVPSGITMDLKSVTFNTEGTAGHTLVLAAGATLAGTNAAARFEAQHPGAKVYQAAAVGTASEFIQAAHAGEGNGGTVEPVFLTLSCDLSVNYIDNGGISFQDLWLYPGSLIDLNGHTLTASNLRFCYKVGGTEALDGTSVLTDASKEKTGRVVYSTGNAANTDYICKKANTVLGGFVTDVYTSSGDAFKAYSNYGTFRVPEGATLHFYKNGDVSPVNYQKNLSVSITVPGAAETDDPFGSMNAELFDAIELQDTMKLRVGYGRTDITPTIEDMDVGADDMGVPLSGYGNTTKRRSLVMADDNMTDRLYATCIAFTDETGETLLLYHTDLIRGCMKITSAVRRAISEATGVPEDNIQVAATHTHSGPDIGNADPQEVRYDERLIRNMVKAAYFALNDRTEVTSMKSAKAYPEGLNFIRHYVTDNGAYVGDNHGSLNGGKYLRHASEADNELQMLKIERTAGDPVVLVNWQTHPHRGGGSTNRNVTSDLVGAMREYVEQNTDLKFAYFTGASGNVNPSSRIYSENLTPDYVTQGRALGGFVKDAVFDHEVETGRIRVRRDFFEAEIRHETDALEEVAREVQRHWAEATMDNWSTIFNECVEIGRPYGIDSPYEAGAIITRKSLGLKKVIQHYVYTVGDLAFVNAPYEMFDVQGRDIKDYSPYRTSDGYSNTFIVTCSNDSNGYLPSRYAFLYESYETDTSKFREGTAEGLAESDIRLLRELWQEKRTGGTASEDLFTSFAVTEVANGTAFVSAVKAAYPSLSSAVYLRLTADVTVNYNQPDLGAQELYLRPGSIIDLNGHKLTLNNVKLFFKIGSEDVTDQMLTVFKNSKVLPDPDLHSYEMPYGVILKVGNAVNTRYALKYAGRFFNGHLIQVESSSVDTFKTPDKTPFMLPPSVTFDLKNRAFDQTYGPAILAADPAMLLNVPSNGTVTVYPITEVASASEFINAVYAQDKVAIGTTPDQHGSFPYSTLAPVFLRLTSDLNLGWGDNRSSVNAASPIHTEDTDGRQVIRMMQGSMIDLNGHEWTLGNLKLFYRNGDVDLDEAAAPFVTDTSRLRTGKIDFRTGNAANTEYVLAHAADLLGGYLKTAYVCSKNAFQRTQATVFRVPDGVSFCFYDKDEAHTVYEPFGSGGAHTLIVSPNAHLSFPEGKNPSQMFSTVNAGAQVIYETGYEAGEVITVKNGRELIAALNRGLTITPGADDATWAYSVDRPVRIRLGASFTVSWSDNVHKSGSPFASADTGGKQTVWVYPGTEIELGRYQLILSNLKLKYKEGTAAREDLLAPILKAGSDYEGEDYGAPQVMFEAGNDPNMMYALMRNADLLGGFLRDVWPCSENAFRNHNTVYAPKTYTVPAGVRLHLYRRGKSLPLLFQADENSAPYAPVWLYASLTSASEDSIVYRDGKGVSAYFFPDGLSE